MTSRKFLIALSLGVALSSSAIAQTSQSTGTASPAVLSYQGQLTADDGSRVSGAKNVRFALYKDAEGSEMIWSEEQSVLFSDGLFNVSLGTANTSLSAVLASGAAFWLGVSIGEAPMMMPLTRIAPSPLAATVADGAITRAKMATEYVPAIEIDGVNVTAGSSPLRLRAGEGVVLDHDRISNVVTVRTATTSVSGKGDDVLANATITGTLTVTKDSYLGTESGNTTVYGNTTLGNGSSNTITFKAKAATNLEMNGFLVKGLGTPSANTDAATKKYVDDAVAGVEGGSGFFGRSGTTISPATAGDNITTSGNLSTSGSGTITSAGTLTASGSLVTQLAAGVVKSTGAGNALTSGSVSLTSEVTGTLPIGKGGTGSTTASDARTALGLGSIATQNADDVTITGGSITGLDAPANDNDAATKLYVDEAISDEVTDRDQAIADAISDEVLDRDQAIADAIADEVLDRDQAIADAIADEVEDRNEAILNAIDQEVLDRNEAILNAIDQEVLDRNEAISNAIDQEVLDRNDAISNAIDQEVLDRDEAISNAIDQEVLDRDDAISNAIDQEVLDRNDAIAAYAWSLDGNASTDDFRLGSTDASAVHFIANDTDVLTLGPGQNAEITGTLAVTEGTTLDDLTVTGTATLDGDVGPSGGGWGIGADGTATFGTVNVWTLTADENGDGITTPSLTTGSFTTESLQATSGTYDEDLTVGTTLTVGDDIMPFEDLGSNLGSIDNRMGEIFVGPSSVHFVATPAELEDEIHLSEPVDWSIGIQNDPLDLLGQRGGLAIGVGGTPRLIVPKEDVELFAADGQLDIQQPLVTSALEGITLNYGDVMLEFGSVQAPGGTVHALGLRSASSTDGFSGSFVIEGDGGTTINSAVFNGIVEEGATVIASVREREGVTTPGVWYVCRVSGVNTGNFSVEVRRLDGATIEEGEGCTIDYIVVNPALVPPPPDED